MGTVAPVVSEIFEETGAYVIRMFLQKKNFFSKIDKNWNKNNKQTSRCYGNSVSRAILLASLSFYLSIVFKTLDLHLQSYNLQIIMITVIILVTIISILILYKIFKRDKNRPPGKSNL